MGKAKKSAKKPVAGKDAWFSDAITGDNPGLLMEHIIGSFNSTCISQMMFHFFFDKSKDKATFENNVRQFIGNFKEGITQKFEEDFQANAKLLVDGYNVSETKQEDAMAMLDSIMKACLIPRMNQFMAQYDVVDSFAGDDKKG